MADNNVNPLLQRELDRKQRLDDSNFLDLFRDRGENFVRGGTPPVEEKNSDNYFYLLEGEHKNITVAKKQTFLVGKPGATFSAPVIINNGGSAIFVNCVFLQTDKNNSALVTIKEGGRAVFQNCIFKRFSKTNKELVGEVPANSAYIALDTTVAAEELATAVGCIFREDADSNASNVVNNIGAAAGTMFIAYSINQTGLPIGAATATGTIT